MIHSPRASPAQAVQSASNGCSSSRDQADTRPATTVGRRRACAALPQGSALTRACARRPAVEAGLNPTAARRRWHNFPIGDIDHAIRLATREPLRKWWRTVGMWVLGSSMLFASMHFLASVLPYVFNGAYRTTSGNLMLDYILLLPQSELISLGSVLLALSLAAVVSSATDQLLKSGSAINNSSASQAVYRVSISKALPWVLALSATGYLLSVTASSISSDYYSVARSSVHGFSNIAMPWSFQEVLGDEFRAFIGHLSKSLIAVILSLGLVAAARSNSLFGLSFIGFGYGLQVALYSVMHALLYHGSGLVILRYGLVSDLHLWLLLPCGLLLYYAILKTVSTASRGPALLLLRLFALCSFCLAMLSIRFLPLEVAEAANELSPFVNILAPVAEPLIAPPIALKKDLEFVPGSEWTAPQTGFSYMNKEARFSLIIFRNPIAGSFKSSLLANLSLCLNLLYVAILYLLVNWFLSSRTEDPLPGESTS